MHMYNFLCSDSLLYTYLFFFLLYMVFIHVIVHAFVFTCIDIYTSTIHNAYMLYTIYMEMDIVWFQNLLELVSLKQLQL